MYELHHDDVRGDAKRPPHGIIPAALKIKYVLNEDPMEARKRQWQTRFLWSNFQKYLGRAGNRSVHFESGLNIAV